MYQKERIDTITEILKKNGYVTVKYLTDELHYSTATVNRDLNVMEKQKMIKRSYGGVELISDKSVPLLFRYHKMKASKNKIGKKAAEFITDGDTIFIDGSTTAQYIGKYITGKKDITIITNNMALVSFLSEYRINVICLGGTVVEPPNMLCGDDTVENAMKYTADKMFFSTGAMNEDGNVGTGGVYHLMHRTMMNNSKKTFLLMDKDKINIETKRYLCRLDEIDCLISDFCFSRNIKEKYKNTKFIEV